MGVCFSIIKKCGSRSRNNSTNNENDSNNQKEDNPSFTKPTTVASASRNPQGQPAQQRQTAQKNLQQPVYKGNPKKPTGAVPCGKRTEFGYFKDFHKRYTIGKLLGHGQFGYTFVATSIDNGYRVAVKRIDKNKMILPISVEDVKREVKILHALTGHENVVQFHNAFEDDSFVYIVMELCEGGELLDRILGNELELTKHMKVYCYFICGKVTEKEIQLKYTCIEDQMANVLMKAVAKRQLSGVPS